MDGDRDERIRQRAHEIWEREGRKEGSEAENWQRAEREVRQEEEAGGTSSGEDGEMPDSRADLSGGGAARRRR